MDLIIVIFQYPKLAEFSDACPAAGEVWQFFSANIIPAIKKWQLEAGGSPGGGPRGRPPLDAVDVLNTFISTVVTHFEQEVGTITTSQVTTTFMSI